MCRSPLADDEKELRRYRNEGFFLRKGRYHQNPGPHVNGNRETHMARAPRGVRVESWTLFLVSEHYPQHRGGSHVQIHASMSQRLFGNREVRTCLSRAGPLQCHHASEPFYLGSPTLWLDDGTGRL